MQTINWYSMLNKKNLNKTYFIFWKYHTTELFNVGLYDQLYEQLNVRVFIKFTAAYS